MSPPVDSWIWGNIPHSSGLNGVPIDPRSNPWKLWILPYMIKSLQKWLRILRWTLFWVIQVGPNAIPCVFNKKRQAEEDYTCVEEKARRRRSREKFEDLGLEDQSEAATSQGMLAATRAGRGRNRSFPRASGGQTCQHLDFTHLTSGTLGE